MYANTIVKCDFETFKKPVFCWFWTGFVPGRVGGTQTVKTLAVFDKYLGENLHTETRQNMIELRKIYFLYNL